MAAKIRALVNGASGRMGQITSKMLKDHPDFELVGETGRGDHLAETIKDTKAQVVIDLTHADVVYKNAQTIIESGAHPVIGTSGLLPQQVIELQKRCQSLKLGGIIAPNFSIGVVLTMKYAQEIAKYFSHVEIIELHHDGKLDSPSGSALYTAELMAKANKNLNQPEKNLHETVSGARGAKHAGVPIHSIRLPGLVAHQRVIFGGLGETLTLSYDTIDRQSFMPGIALACKKAMELKELVYGLENVL